MDRSRSWARSWSGAVETRLRSWLSAWVRALRAPALVHPQNPYGFDASVLGLGHRGGVARLGGPGRRDRVEAVGLALAATPLAVRSIDLDDGHARLEQVAGEPGAVGAGALDPHPLDGAEALQPVQQSSIAGGGGGERLDAEQPA